jgi:hypothetical protein
MDARAAIGKNEDAKKADACLGETDVRMREFHGDERQHSSG